MTLIPTQVTFRGIPHSDALEADIRERVASLEQFHAGIVGCRVLVEIPHRHRQDDRRFHVRVEITLPGRAPIVVSHEPSTHGALRDVEESAHHKGNDAEGGSRNAHASVKEAFEVARRQVQQVARERREEVRG